MEYIKKELQGEKNSMNMEIWFKKMQIYIHAYTEVTLTHLFVKYKLDSV